MRTIGLIGGMSWESSAEYYRLLNEDVRDRLGGQHNAHSLMYTVDFAEIEAMQRAGDWDAAADALADAAAALERGGADLIGLCTNTMHLVADRIEAAVNVPFVHLVNATAEKIRAAGLRQVGLLAWHRWATLAMLAYAFLALTRARETDPQEADMIPLTCNEVRHLLIRAIAPDLDWGHRLRWSAWRRRHQATAQRLHYERRDALAA